MTERLKAAIRQTADAVNDVINRLIPKSNEMESQLFDAMRYATLEGGKRMRPLLVLTSCELFNVDYSCALRVAAAVEMVHAYSLIHDDLPAMDDAKLRRGRPTVHCEFDEATAILAGDALQSLAFEVLADPDSHPDARIRLKLVEGLARAVGPRGMCGGQMLDLLSETQKLDVGAVTRMQKMKTGALIMFACEVGAIMGKAAPKHAMALRNYAHDFGMAFQMTDDLLDLTGVQQDLGKETGKDAKAGKKNFLAFMAPGEARAKCELLVDQCIHHLSVFDESRTGVLVDLAKFLLERKN
ncbi:MAG: farnesyl-diphosphate synthase [Alphaproteobacteria bacterium]|nr:farnesyl-diphosphate synthase [Alphaproteobacteria bacterium]